MAEPSDTAVATVESVDDALRQAAAADWERNRRKGPWGMTPAWYFSEGWLLGHRTGYTAALQTERARIVAWLRDTGDQHSLVYQAGMTVTQAADRLAEEA